MLKFNLNNAILILLISFGHLVHAEYLFSNVDAKLVKQVDKCKIVSNQYCPGSIISGACCRETPVIPGASETSCVWYDLQDVYYIIFPNGESSLLHDYSIKSSIKSAQNDEKCKASENRNSDVNDMPEQNK